MFGNEYLICGGCRHPPHPTAGGGDSPDPWNKMLRSVVCFSGL
ncbi:MAG: hypothetical protein PVF83_12420 [Anaerolineales bacterium]